MSLILGWISGMAWSSANLIFLKKLAVLLSDSQPNRRNLIFLLLMKFAVLYPIGIGLLYSRAVSLAAFAGGFTLVLIGAAMMAAFSGKMAVARV